MKLMAFRAPRGEADSFASAPRRLFVISSLFETWLISLTPKNKIKYNFGVPFTSPVHQGEEDIASDVRNAGNTSGSHPRKQHANRVAAEALSITCIETRPK
jgi:hypothetical protein